MGSCWMTKLVKSLSGSAFYFGLVTYIPPCCAPQATSSNRFEKVAFLEMRTRDLSERLAEGRIHHCALCASAYHSTFMEVVVSYVHLWEGVWIIAWHASEPPSITGICGIL